MPDVQANPIILDRVLERKDQTQSQARSTRFTGTEEAWVERCARKGVWTQEAQAIPEQG